MNGVWQVVFKGQSQKWQVLKKTWSEMTIPEIGRQDAVLQFVFWGDIAVVSKQALKEEVGFVNHGFVYGSTIK